MHLGEESLYPQTGSVRERGSEVAGNEWNLHLLSLVRPNRDDAHGEIILVWELSTGEEAELLGPVGTGKTIASENTVNTNSVVKVVSSLGGGKVVNIVIGRLALDLHDFSTSKAFPVEAELVVETRESTTEQVDEID